MESCQLHQYKEIPMENRLIRFMADTFLRKFAQSGRAGSALSAKKTYTGEGMLNLCIFTIDKIGYRQ